MDYTFNKETEESELEIPKGWTVDEYLRLIVGYVEVEY